MIFVTGVRETVSAVNEIKSELTKLYEGTRGRVREGEEEAKNREGGEERNKREGEEEEKESSNRSIAGAVRLLDDALKQRNYTTSE